MAISRQLYDSLNDIDDIWGLIHDEERESVNLDYKEANKQWDSKAKQKIAKHISAFANSEGGVIIFGVECDKNDEDKPVDITGLHAKNTPETFDRIVSSNIRPAIEGWDRKPLTKGDKSVLIAQIPKSDLSPHQSLPHKQYFHRSGAQSLAMEHYLVDLHFGRSHKPALRLSIVESEILYGGVPSGFVGDFIFQVFVNNAGTGNAEGLSGQFKFPPKKMVKVSAVGKTSERDGTTIERIQARDVAKENNDTFYFRTKNDVYPGAERCIAEFQLSFHPTWLSESTTEPLINWDIFTTGMEPKKGTFRLSERMIETIRALPKR